MNHRYLTYGSLVLAVLFWGLSFVATKIALQSFTPFCLIFTRFSAAALFFALLLFRKGAPLIQKTTFKKIFLLALFQPGLYFFFETYGLKYTTATKTSLIIATIPIVVMVLSIIFLKERVRPVNVAGIVISLVGIVMLVFGSSGHIEIYGIMLGDLLVSGAVLSAAIYMIFTRHLGKTIPPTQITGLQMIFGTVIFFPFFLWDQASMDWGRVSVASVTAIVGLIVFATIGAFLCYNFALSKLEATKVSVFINVIPIVTAIGAWALLDESLSAMQLGGGSIVIGAVYLANYSKRTPSS
jgi:drug/metabolite transporter (DMT)-like permease